MPKLASLGLVVVLLAAVGCAGTEAPSASAPPPAEGESLDTLIAAAQAEGELIVYTSAADVIDGNLAAAFEELYGIAVLRTKLTSSEVAVRYQTEGASGRILADIVSSTCADAPFFEEIAEHGWAIPAEELGLPGLEGDGSRYIVADGTTFQYFGTPMVIGYNTEAFGGEEPPASWEDLADPALAGKIVMVEPTSSVVYMYWLQWLADQYGEDFLEELGALDLQYAEAGAARNLLGAEQAWIDVPTFESSMVETAESGAPVSSIMPATTPGNFSCIGVTAAEHAPNPNAARLFAHFLTSPEAEKALEDAPGVYSPFGPTGIPAGLEALPTEHSGDALVALIGR